MFNSMCKALEKPPIYTKTATAFWNDTYISKQMLKAHLNPDFEGASRKLAFIEKSVAWIKDMVPPKKYPLLLDLGCGPGIYAERFAGTGYQVTGVDISKGSIEYAQSSAYKKGFNITYLHENYLSLRLNAVYDFATMIYCDYGALSKTDRQILMRNIYQHLKDGGKFLFDVFSIAKYNAFQEKQTWEIHNNGGFWRAYTYLELYRCCKYCDSVTLEQTSIIADKEVVTYYLWNTCFTKEVLMQEAREAGFKVCEIFGDIAGEAYNKNNFTMAILLEK